MFKFFLGKIYSKSEDLGFWEHVEELRGRFIKSILAVAFFSIIAFFFKSFIFDTIILAPQSKNFITYKWLCELGNALKIDDICPESINFSLINIDLAGQFRWHIIISFVTGIIISFPFIFRQFWFFIKPALKPNELKYSRGMIFYINLLFIIGVLFGYFIIMPLTIMFLSNYTLSPHITNQITISSYISTTVVLPLSTGLIFEMPVLIYLLSKINLISYSFLKKYRKHAAVLILIIAAIITPSTDMFTMLIVAIPLYLLYELSLIIAKSVLKSQKQAG